MRAFVEDEALPGTGVTAGASWSGPAAVDEPDHEALPGTGVTAGASWSGPAAVDEPDAVSLTTTSEQTR